MKTIKKMAFIILTIAGFATVATAGNKGQAVVAVLGIDCHGLGSDAQTISYMVRLELEKTSYYQVMDPYDVAAIMKSGNMESNNCFGKSCLIAAGKLLGADKVLTGSADRLGEKIVISLKIYDVATEVVERSDVTEYLNIEQEIQKMIGISVQKLLGMTPDRDLVGLLVNYDTPIESPKNKLTLSGPRMGFSCAFGESGRIFMAKESEGGFDMLPVMFQFGWQQEIRYLSSGNFQALIEIIPMIGGLESGRFVPSLTFMNGFRAGKSGWEIAFGPSFRFVQKAKGFYDSENYFGRGEGAWILEQEWYTQPHENAGQLNPYLITKRLDSRGNPNVSTILILSVGRTFRSGYLNIPVNLYVSTRKEGTIAGFSFGFNITRKPKVKTVAMADNQHL